MTLKDTAKLMVSDDYKDRFRAEYFQLKIRYDKLCAMLNKWDAGTLEFAPTCLAICMMVKCERCAGICAFWKIGRGWKV